MGYKISPFGRNDIAGVFQSSHINDARALKLPLLGGNTGDTSPYGFHDWEFILTELGWLQYDRIFASIAYKIGIIVMFICYIQP